jgi:hypothetical protein
LALTGIQDWKARLSRIVEQGIERKDIRANVSAVRIANSIVATLEGALMISRLEGARDALQDAQATLEIMLDGLAN